MADWLDHFEFDLTIGGNGPVPESQQDWNVEDDGITIAGKKLCYREQVKHPFTATTMKEGGKKAVMNYLATVKIGNSQPLSEYLQRDYYANLDVETLVITTGDYRGKIPNRISAYLKKKHGIDITPEIMTQIGSIVAANRAPQERVFDLTDKIDWGIYKDGKVSYFGDDGACWINGGRLGGHRATLERLKHKAMRFFDPADPTKGISRAWLKGYRLKDGTLTWIIWNPYGKVEIGDFASVFAHHFGMTYRVIAVGMRNTPEYNNYREGTLGYSLYGANSAAIIAPFDVIEKVPGSLMIRANALIEKAAVTAVPVAVDAEVARIKVEVIARYEAQIQYQKVIQF